MSPLIQLPVACYCGHPASEHMESPPWQHSPRVSPDGRLLCSHSECPCEGYDPMR